MSHLKIQEIVENFYRFFNASEFESLFSLIDDSMIHEINYVQTKGKDKFIDFILKNKKHYDETVSDYVLMSSDDMNCLTTKFKVKGKYVHTDDSALPASNQDYELDVINYFEIKNNKIVKGLCWFNENEFIRQVAPKN
ncbi:MAG TPA: hypothetical protein VD770_01535 [Coxiellaceae bacterium]|nr:hypothetical protein [Coxiellaceae bacterium]